MSAVTRRSAAGEPGPDRSSARYVAIIADGNRRWARSRGLSVNQGHEAGARTARACVRDAVELGIEQLALFAFSTENWSRPRDEVQELLSIISQRIASDAPDLSDEGVRIGFVGRREGVPRRLVEQIDWAEELTRENAALTLFVALNYGGRAEIIDAARRFSAGDEREFSQHLYARDMHDPDVIIRTGGERRLSNYLLWQGAYSELVFRDELWPDFTRGALEQSLSELDARERRFGGRARPSAG